MTQAEDRLHRQGQLNFVFNRYFYHPGTIDQHQRKVLTKKESWARLVLDPEQLLAPSWRD
jgi:hypothetical protein